MSWSVLQKRLGDSDIVCCLGGWRCNCNSTGGYFDDQKPGVPEPNSYQQSWLRSEATFAKANSPGEAAARGAATCTGVQ
ncbi:hypothetical protein WJX73_000690 [Symbiochloris irregularis]|uniref:Uncharacterized protein n=1 Tax=Symbiochloris irregularis TaxID=706552 RepID=A0AAW1PZL9_9CHLO